MITATAYVDVIHDVLLVDTSKLVQMEEEKIRLSRMNSGSTKRMAHPRDMNLFKTFADYPFEFRRERYGKAKAVAEVCVLEGVDGIAEAVLEIKRGSADDIMAALMTD